MRNYKKYLEQIKNKVVIAEELNKKYLEEQSKIWNDAMKSGLAKQAALDELKAKYGAEFDKVGENIDEEVEGLKKALEGLEEEFDYTNPRLQAAINWLKLGRKTPEGVVKQIVKDFDRPAELEYLASVAREAGGTDNADEIEKKLSTRTAPIDRLADAFYYKMKAGVTSEKTWNELNKIIGEVEEAYKNVPEVE